MVLTGGPGSGKSTHGQALAEALGHQHLSSGARLRDRIRWATRLSRRAKEPIKDGRFIPDNATSAWAWPMIGGCPDASGFDLDGYQRSLPQAKALDVPGLLWL